jgi:conjugative transfer signal peptidase TraF
VPEHRELPLFRWGEELRRDRNARRASRRTLLLASGCTAIIVALLATLLWPPRPLLVWNASASSPTGLYLVQAPGRVAVDDMVVAWLPDDARRLGAARHYIPANVPLVKRVAAVAGDEVCAVGEAIFVNGRLEALRRSHDPAGRAMPWWTGCGTLREGELFLLMPGAGAAFDGRYFGITRPSQVVGSARLIWRN